MYHKKEVSNTRKLFTKKYMGCSKWPSFSQTQAQSRTHHCKRARDSVIRVFLYTNSHTEKGENLGNF